MEPRNKRCGECYKHPVCVKSQNLNDFGGIYHIFLGEFHPEIHTFLTLFKIWLWEKIAKCAL